jgi:hypothetical protein
MPAEGSLRAHPVHARIVFTPAVLLAILLVSGCSRPQKQPAVAQAPTLEVTLVADPLSAITGQSVTFNYTVSPSDSSPNAGITSAIINFGDGQTYDGGSAGPRQVVRGVTVHAFSVTGTHTVTLKTTSSERETGLATITVSVAAKPPPPVIQLRADSASVAAGQPVTFTFTVSGATGLTLQLSYGDGSVDPIDGATGTASHAYGSSGSYQVFITATDGAGQIAGAASTIVQVGT